MTTALLVIDVQQALCSGPYEAFESRHVVDRINHVIRVARQAGTAIVFIQHEEEGGPLAYESDGWKLDAELDAQPSDLYVRKTASDAFHNTELHAILQTRNVTALVVCGLQSEFCVDTTTRRALALGYPVTLVADGHSTMDNGILTAAQIIAHHNATLKNLDSFGLRVRTMPAAEVQIAV